MSQNGLHVLGRLEHFSREVRGDKLTDEDLSALGAWITAELKARKTAAAADKA